MKKIKDQNPQDLQKNQRINSKNFLNQYLHNNFLMTLIKIEAQWPPQLYNNQFSVQDITTKLKKKTVNNLGS